MASAILAIYDTLAATTVSDGVQEIAAVNVGDQPNSLNSADAPLRLLTVLDPMAGTMRAASDTAWGAGQGSGIMQITWNLFDVLYHTPAFQGRGVRDYNEPLLVYQANYFDMLKTLDFGEANVTRVPVTMQPAILEYPLRSGHFWYAVRVTLAIQEGPC